MVPKLLLLNISASRYDELHVSYATTTTLPWLPLLLGFFALRRIYYGMAQACPHHHQGTGLSLPPPWHRPVPTTTMAQACPYHYYGTGLPRVPHGPCLSLPPWHRPVESGFHI